MLETIESLPSEIWGVLASGKLSRQDYERTVTPYLEQARREGRRVRGLLCFDPDFEGLSPAAAWEDLRVGLRHLRRFEALAIVSDTAPLRRVASVVGALLPCPVRTFEQKEFDRAVEWLQTVPRSTLQHRIYADLRVLVIEPEARLRAQDFDSLAASLDAWTESTHGPLKGIVVHAREFPGWQDVGSFVRHVQFVSEHHDKIDRVALAVDGTLATLGPSLLDRFMHAELKHFSADDLQGALAWAAAPRKDRAQEEVSASAH